MAKIKINGDSSGYVEIAAPNAANNNTLELGPGTKILTDSNPLSDIGSIGIATDNPGSGNILAAYGRTQLGPQSDASDATTKAEMISKASLSVKPHPTNSGTLNFAQVDNGSGIGLQFTNGSGTSNWNMVLQPFGGKVAIGTDSPNKVLKVEYPDPGSGSDGLTQKDTGNDTTTFFGTVGPTYNYIGHQGHAGMVYSSRDLAIGVDHNNNGVIKFYTGNNERLRITSAGDVGIGTAVPIISSGYGNLSLAKTNGGQLELKKLSSGRQHYIWGDDNLNIGAAYNGGGSGDLIVKVNGNNERLRINSNSQLLHTRTDNVQRYDLEFRQTGGISDGNYGGIHWTQGSTGSTNLGAIEINYADTGRPDIVFKTRQSGGTAMSEAARIDSVGRFRIANQPAFFVYKNQSSWALAAGDTFVFNTAEFNVGSHYNTTNGRFTAPVGGTYVFHFWSIYTGNASSDYIQMYRNGARMYGGDVHFTNDVGSQWDSVHYSRVIQLNANDYVYMRSGSAHTYHGNHWGGWSGYMLG